MENFIVGNKENFKELISSDKITIVDFWAEWCGPCRTQLPILENYAQKNEDIQVVKVNVDQNSELASEYGIRSIPTILYFKKGTIQNKTVGVQQEDQLNEIKKQIL
jgi:thioredoxin 1